MNTKETNANSQFVLSYELLALLRWLVENDDDKLKKIIGKALKSGLHEELNRIDQVEEASLLDDMQHSITDFLGLMEALLIESVSEHIKERAKVQNLMPAIDQIDSTLCDDSIVQYSLEKASTKLESNPHVNPRDLLFKEILKRWKPIDKNTKN